MSRKPLPEFLTWREGKSWLCGWQRCDILTQGRTEAEANERMARVVCAWVLEITDPVATTKHFPKHRPDVLRKWGAAHRRTHG